MIRKAAECKVDHKEHMRDGDGTVLVKNLITGPEELNGKGRLFSELTLNPGCSIGFHVHENESELFKIRRMVSDGVLLFKNRDRHIEC